MIPVKLRTPMAAIHAACLECQGGNIQAVRICYENLCPLWPFRRTPREPTAKGTPLQAIRAKCIDCTGGINAIQAIRDCDCDCALRPLRFGKPAIKMQLSDAERQRRSEMGRAMAAARKRQGDESPGHLVGEQIVAESSGEPAHSRF